MLVINKNSSYQDVQTVVNNGVTVDVSGIVTSSGTDQDTKTRHETLNKLLVVLKHIDQETEFRLGVSFRLDNSQKGLKAVPRVAVLRKLEDGTFKKLLNVDRIPAEWLELLAKTQNTMKQWMNGQITAYSDAWPRGFVEDELPESE